MAPPETVHLYQVEKIDRGFIKISETLEKLKIELKVDSFVSLSDHPENLYEKILSQKDIARKTLTFMDGSSQMADD